MVSSDRALVFPMACFELFSHAGLVICLSEFCNCNFLLFCSSLCVCAFTNRFLSFQFGEEGKVDVYVRSICHFFLSSSGNFL